MMRLGKWAPLGDTMINGTLDNVMGIRGHHFDDMMRKLGALDGAMENLGPFAL